MDKKIELQVINITNSQAQVGAFAMLLGEVNGERQLPVIIGPAEAQATALYLKGINPPRPLTHDLFMTSLTVMGASLLRVLIYKAKEGIFYSYIYLKKDDEITRIDARTSDAIALAVRADCPILIYNSLLERECLHLSDEESPHSEDSGNDEEEQENPVPSNVTSISLEEELEKAIKAENYELAAKIRDQINVRNQNQ
ncbi:bifunctional nuclease family protein [Bacteroides bouchesdurhonensis]|uniref:bifunctional nuclease family protein n=1 Tax=Bacteroides bouchesdurhonensis TaxID=1841855 RepID=UPI0011DD25FA|nr:bifunctional nuclease family protein [Bacteroides bouchesdurhonensis]